MLIPLNEYKEYISYDVNDTTYDGEFTNKANAAEETVSLFLGKPFGVQTFVDRFIGDRLRSNLYCTRNYPVKTISKLQYYNQANGVWTDYVEGTDYTYVLFDDYKVLFNNFYFQVGKLYALEYTAGFELADLDDLLKQTCKDIFKVYVNESNLGRNVLGADLTIETSVEGIGSKHYKTTDEIIDALLKRIEKYADVNI